MTNSNLLKGGVPCDDWLSAGNVLWLKQDHVFKCHHTVLYLMETKTYALYKHKTSTAFFIHAAVEDRDGLVIWHTRYFSTIQAIFQSQLSPGCGLMAKELVLGWSLQVQIYPLTSR